MFNPGTLIANTTKLSDLIPTFLEAIKDTAEYTQLIACNAAIPSYVQDEGESSEWWDSEDAHHLFNELCEVLNNYAPDDHFFGSHPNDGADFGFWEV